MSTQKQKFRLFSRLQSLGFTYDEAVSLRRIEMTLQRWAEAECGDSNDYCSTGIERDEATGKPFRVIRPHSSNKAQRYAVEDREAGALRRLARIVAARNARNPNDEVVPYHQGDCRGCMLYLVTRTELAGMPIEQAYTRGLAVCC